MSRCGEAPADARLRLVSASSIVTQLPAARLHSTDTRPKNPAGDLGRYNTSSSPERAERRPRPRRLLPLRLQSPYLRRLLLLPATSSPRATPRNGTAPTHNRSASIYPSAAPANDGATTAPSGASPASDAYGTTPAHTHAATAKPRLDDVRVFFCCGSDPSTLVERRGGNWLIGHADRHTGQQCEGDEAGTQSCRIDQMPRYASHQELKFVSL